jgi:small subunit ribosomal protein S21
MSTKPNVSVVVQRDESIERALKRFKRLCEHAGIRKAVRAKSYYEKPSEARRRELRKAIRNRRRAEKKAQERAQRKLDRGRNRRGRGGDGDEGGEGGGRDRDRDGGGRERSRD